MGFDETRRVRVGINGLLGRIGLMLLGVYYEMGPDKFPNIVLGAGNLSGHPGAYGVDRILYDTAHRRWELRVPGVAVEFDEGTGELVIGSDRIMTVSTKKDIPLWGGALLQCPLVIDCTGQHTSNQKALPHLMEGGAQRFLISAPPKTGEVVDRIVVQGINHTTLQPEDRVVSAASCTTTALAPMVQAILDAGIGIKVGWMTSIHSATASQHVVDGNNPKDPAKGRATLGNFFQTSTGAARMIGKVIPEMEGVLSGTAWRLPTVDGSALQLSFQSGRDGVTVEEVRQAFRGFATKHPNLMKVMNRDIVAADIVHDATAVIVDLKHVYVQQGPDGHEQIVVTGWYDNEWGYAFRLLELANYAAGQMLAA